MIPRVPKPAVVPLGPAADEPPAGEEKPADPIVARLQELLARYDEQLEQTLDIRRSLRQLHTENRTLKYENTELKRKMSRVTDTWYGRFAMKSFRVLAGMKRGLVSVVRRKK